MAAQENKEKSEKAYRTISEAADIVGVETHVLRFWETRFPNLSPMKRAGGRRYYSPEDIALLNRIRTLLYDEEYTISGARKKLEKTDEVVPPASASSSGLSAKRREVLSSASSELAYLRDLLRESLT